MAAGALALAAAFGVVKLSILAWGAVSGIITAAGVAWEAYTLWAGGAATAQEALNLVMAANPIGLVVVAVAALIAGITALVLNWDNLMSAIGLGKPRATAVTSEGATDRPDYNGFRDSGKAPNTSTLSATKVQVDNHINVDNTRAPGTTSTVKSAPQLSGYSQGKNK